MAKGSLRPKAIPHRTGPLAPAPEKPRRTVNVQTFLWRIGLPLLLAALTFLAYAPSLKSGFVYDARIEILQEGFITSLANLPAVLSLKVLGMNIILGRRPGQLLFMMLNGAVWGKAPWGFHLASNFLHAANVGFLFVVLRRLLAAERIGQAGKGLLKAQLAAVAIILIFALHPLAVEPVAAVNYSSDLLVTFFTLLALLAATAFRPESMRNALLMGGLGTLSAFAAVTCKESGLAAALLLIVYWFLFRRNEAKAPWLWFLGAATVVTVIFLAIRFLFAPPGALPPDYLGGSFFQVPLAQSQLWVFMLGKLFWPVDLSADYTPEDWNAISLPFALAVLVVVVLGQVWLAARSRIGALGVAVYWLGLVTVSNFVPLYRIVADRFYYLPLAGAALQLVALLLLTLKSNRGFWAAMIPCLIALVPLTMLTLTRQAVFASDFSLWSDTVRVSPSSSVAHNNLGEAFLKKGRADDAIAEEQKALAMCDNYSEAHNNLGDALLRKGQLDAAIAQDQKAVQINPDYVDAHNNLGWALAQKGRIDDAMVQYQEALKLNPNCAEAFANLGIALFNRGQVDAAVADYRKALELDPNLAEARNNLGNALIQGGQLDAATTEYRKALDINPDFAEARYGLGNVLVKKGQVDDAIIEYQKALEIDPELAEVHTNLGIAFAQKGQVDAAMAEYLKAVEINPNYPEGRYNLGMALSQKGHLDDAIVQYQKAVEINPEFVQARCNLGVALYQKGQVDAALAQFQKATEINPGYADAHNNLGFALFHKGQVDLAMVQFQKAMAIDPSNLDAHFNLGNALVQKGQIEKAIAQFQEVLRLNPRDQNAQINLAKAQAMSRSATSPK